MDIALRYYGSVEHIVKIVEDNDGIELNSNIGATTVLNIDDEFEDIREDIVAFMKSQEDQGRPNANWTEGQTGDYNTDYNDDYDI